MFGGLGLSATRTSSATFNPPTTTPAHKTAQKLQLLNMSAVTVVTDFLSAVRTTTIESIERTYDAEWVQESKIEYVLTVPAIWSDSAKSLMVQAAKEAGFGTHRVDFNLVSEPEAAAAHALRVIQPHNLNVSRLNSLRNTQCL
jgi:molecular chaperone DnaK (HSP70)